MNSISQRALALLALFSVMMAGCAPSTPTPTVQPTLPVAIPTVTSAPTSPPRPTSTPLPASTPTVAPTLTWTPAATLSTATTIPIGKDCRAQLFDVPLERPEQVEQVELQCLSNDIIVGLLGVTLLE